LKNGFHLPPKESPNIQYIYEKVIILSIKPKIMPQEIGLNYFFGCIEDFQKADKLMRFLILSYF